MNTPTIVMGELHPGRWGGWARQVTVDGVLYWVGVETGKRVRIPFKPRGTYGYQWHGYCRDAAGKYLYRAQVTGSTGARWLLEAAGVVPLRPSEQRKVDKREASEREQRNRGESIVVPGARVYGPVEVMDPTARREWADCLTSARKGQPLSQNFSADAMRRAADCAAIMGEIEVAHTIRQHLTQNPEGIA